MGVDETRRFESCRDTQRVLESIAVSDALAPADGTLVDDNIDDCLAACAAGYGVWWSTWGHKTAGSDAPAVARGITAMSIDVAREAAAPRTR
jgi:hypothetical protein